MYARTDADSSPFPSTSLEAVLASSPRDLARRAALGLAAGNEVLTPAYNHGSEVGPSSARASLPVYEGGKDSAGRGSSNLLPDRARALYLTHYLGFPQDAERWRKWCDERGLDLLEDAAQAWLGTSEGVPLGSLGDLSIFCLYKTVGVPDGGALLCRVPAGIGEGSHTLRSGPLLRRHAAWLAGRSSLLARLYRLRKAEVYDVNEDFALGDPDIRRPPPSSSSSNGWSTSGRRDSDGLTTSCCFASSGTL